MDSKGKQIFAAVMAVFLALSILVPSLAVIVNADDDDHILTDEEIEAAEAERLKNEGQQEEEDEEESSYQADDYSEEKADLKDLNARLSELQSQQNAIQQKINAAKSEKDKQLAQKQQIDTEMQFTLAQLDVLNQRITLLEENIAQKEDEMQIKQKDIDKNYELFKQRLRANYIAGNSSTIGMVLGADSFSQFLLRAEVATRISQYDQDVIDTLTREKEALNAIKVSLDKDKADLEKDKKEMEEKKQQLDTQLKETQDKIQDIAAMEQEFLANKEALTKQMQEVQAVITAIYDKINANSSNIPYVGGEMMWPSRTLAQITSSFGSRFGGNDYHTGIDISGGGAMGSPVLAANTGTVAHVTTNFTPGYVYGKYLIIDPGGGKTTLYAHCSSISVSEGDTVVKGQEIAKVGSTGWSTGPHIHFEVRINGKAVNPMGYVSA